jgi:hypothetical protein
MNFNPDPSERAYAGMEWLDENGPAEWWDRVDLDTLDISDGNTCVLGHVFAAEAAEVGLTCGYFYATVGSWNAEPMIPSDQVIELGFCTTMEENHIADEEDLHPLEDAWTFLINKRRIEVNA